MSRCIKKETEIELQISNIVASQESSKHGAKQRAVSRINRLPLRASRTCNGEERLFKGAASIFPFRVGYDADTRILSGIWCALGHREKTKKPAARDDRSEIGLEASKTSHASRACRFIACYARLVQRRHDCI